MFTSRENQKHLQHDELILILKTEDSNNDFDSEDEDSNDEL